MPIATRITRMARSLITGAPSTPGAYRRTQVGWLRRNELCRHRMRTSSDAGGGRPSSLEFVRLRATNSTLGSVDQIGAAGFEPATSPTRTVRATRLRHAPTASHSTDRASRLGALHLCDGGFDLLRRGRVLKHLRLGAPRPLDHHRGGGAQAQVGGQLSVGLHPRRDLGRVASLPPGVEVEVRNRVADVVEELVRDRMGRGLVLVSEEELDELPLAVLLAGGGRRIRRLGGLGLAQRVVVEFEPGLAGARVLLDQPVDGAELVVVASGALEVVEDGERHRRVRGPQGRAILLDPADQLLDLVAAADLDHLRAALADREGDDRGEQADCAGAQEQARQPGASHGYPATAL